MSTTIDEKVVSMEFDNADFEKNVAESLSTLDKLKQALNFDGAEDGLKDISKAASNVDMSDLVDSIEEVQVSFSSLDVISATVLSNITTSVMNTASKITSSVTSLISTGGKTRALNIEQARFQLEGLGLDVEAVMINANDAVTDTAYGLDEAAKAAAQFGASGLQAGEDMTAALRAIAGVAAMTSSDYSSIADIFTTVAGNGKLMTMQLRQLSSRGLNAAATLADYLGKTEAEVRDMVSDGEISFETFYKAMDEAFGEHAKSANETFSGAMSNVRAAFSRIGADFWTPMLENMKNLMNALIPVINAFRSAISPTIDLVTGFATTVSDKLVTVMDSLFSTDKDKPTTWFSNLADALSGSDSKWSSFTKQVEDAGISMDEFQEALNEVAKSEGLDLNSLIDEYGSLQKVVESGTITSDMLTASLQNISADAASAVKATESATEVLEYYKEVVWDVWMGDYDNGAARKSLLTEAGYDYATVQSLVNKTTEDYTVTLDMLTEAELVNLGYTEEEIALIQDLSDAAAESGSDFNTLINSFTDTESAAELFQDSISNIKTFLSDIGKAVSNGWSDVFSAPSVDSVAEAIRNAMKAFKEFTSVLTISDDVGRDLAATFGGIFAAADIVFNLVGGTGKAVLQVLYEVLKNVTEQLGITVSNVLDITGTIGRAIMQVDYWIKDNKTLAKILNTISDVISDVVVYIIKFVGAIADLSSSGIASAVKAIADSISSILGDFERGFDEGTSALSIFTDSAVNGFTAIGEVLASGISDGITTIVQFIAKIFEGIAAISKWISENKLISKSISTVITALATAINWVTKFVNKILETPQVQSAITAIGEAFQIIGETIEEYFTKGVETISEFVDGIKELSGMSLSEATEEVKNFISSFTSGIDLSGIKESFTQVPAQAIAGIKIGFSNGLGDIVSAAAEACSALMNTFCDMLGIHSPAQWFIDLIMWCAQGIVVGAKKAISTVVKACTPIVEAMQSVFEQIDFGKLFVTGVSFGSFAAIYKTIKTVEQMTTALQNFMKPITEIGKSINDTVKAAQKVLTTLSTSIQSYTKAQIKSIKAKSLLTIAEALALLAASIFLLTIPDTDKLWSAVAAIGALAAILLTLSATMSKIDASDLSFAKLDTIILSLGVTLLLVSSAIKKVAKLDTNSAVTAMQGLGLILAEMGIIIAGLSWVTGLDKAGDISKVGTLFLAMSGSLILIAQAIKMIGKLDASQVSQSLTAITEIMVLLGVFLLAYSAINNKIGNMGDMDKAGTMFLKMSTSLILMSAAIKLIGGMDQSAVNQGISAIAGLLTIMGLITIFVSFSKEDAVTKAGSLFLSMGASMVLLAAAMKIMGSLSTDDLITGTICMGLLLVVMGLMTAITKFAGDNVAKAGLMILEVSAALILIAAAMAMMSMMSTDDLIIVTIMLTEILGWCAVLVAISHFSGGNAAKAGAMVLEISAALILIAVAMKVVASLSDDEIVRGTACIVLLSAFIAAWIGLSKFAGAEAQKVGVMILEISVAMIVLIGCIALMSYLNPEDVVRGTLCISALMGMIALLIAASANAEKIDTVSLVLIIALVGVVAAVIYVLSDLPVEGSIGAATAMSELLLALSVSIAVLTKFGSVKQGFLRDIASTLLALVVVIAALGAIITAMQYFGADGGESVLLATALSEALIAVSGCTAVLTKLKINPADAATAATGLAAFVGVITAVGLVLAELNNITGGWVGGALDAAFDILSQVASGLGEVVGSFIGGIGVGLTEQFIEMAENLSTAMTKLNTFFTGLTNIDSSMVEGVKNLAEIMLYLSGSELLNWITSVATGNQTSLTDFGEQLQTFGTALAGFGTSTANIDKEAIENAAEAGKAVTEFAATIPNSGGALGVLVGNNDLGTFAEAIGYYSGIIKGIYISFKDIEIDDDFKQKVDNLASLGDSFVTLANSIPNTGGFVSVLAGDNDLGTFAESIKSYVGAMIGIKESLKGNAFGDDFTSKIDALAKAGTALATLENTLPESTGVIQEIFGGGTEWATISTGLAEFGTAMAGFYTAIAGIDWTDDTIGDAITVASMLSELQANLPPESGWIEKIFGGGTGTWDTLATGLEKLAEGMGTFSSTLVDQNINWDLVTTAADKFGTITTSLQAINAIDATQFDSLNTAIEDFVSCCVSIASMTVTDEQIDNFIDKVTKIAEINIDGSSIEASAESIRTALTDLMSTLMENVSNESTNFSEAMETALGGLVTGITNQEDEVLTAIKNLMEEQLVGGIKGKQTSVETAVDTVAGVIATGIEAVYDDVKSAGEYVGDGLIAGINAKKTAVYNAGYALGEKVNAGIKAATDENSPSKVAEQSGIYVGEGLVIGLNSMAQSVYDAGYSMGDTSVSAISSAIQQISEAVNTDLDTQPTITPVLDLSNVSDGANSISNMLNFGSNGTLMANVNSLNAQLNGKIQNGNEDLIDAIYDLKDSMNGGTTTINNINGVTYDDGSNINNAVSEIVRAARIERRT